MKAYYLNLRKDVITEEAITNAIYSKEYESYDHEDNNVIAFEFNTAKDRSAFAFTYFGIDLQTVKY